jgi:hypothetical protein
MSPKARTLSLLALSIAIGSLAGACSEEPQLKKEPLKATARVEQPVMPAPSPRLAEPPLTATAPAKPHSILDSAPKPAELEAPGIKPELTAEAEAAKDSPEPALDFDRSVAPEEVHVVRFVLATDVQSREPVGESDHFDTETPKIFAFVQFENELAAPFAVRVHWEKLDGPSTPYGFKLEVPTAARHRTWSWTKIRREPGQYRAVLRTLDGQDVAQREFVIEPATTAAELDVAVPVSPH